jgi:hypothetical protein
MIRKLKVCSSIYEIEYKKEVKDERNSDLFGKIDYGELKIIVDKNYPILRQTQSVLHEGMHAIDHEYQFGFEEKTTERLSNAIYAFLIDNKKFINEIIN